MLEPFFVSWALGYSLTKGVDAIRERLHHDPLVGELRKEAHEWTAQLPDHLGEDLDPGSVLGQMFRGERTSTHYGEAQKRLSSTVNQPAVPSEEEWLNALIERWQEVRQSLSAAEAHPFFTQKQGKAEEQFRDLAGRLHRVCHQSDEHFRNTIAFAVQELEKKVNQLSDTPWETPKDYFSSLMNGQDLFRHSWHLVGREEVCDALRCFAFDERKRVAILPGRGGIGKSKVLQAFSVELLKHDESPDIRFVKGSAKVKQTFVESLPDGESLVIVLDDAHRRDQNELLSLLRVADQRNAMGIDTKLIFVTRPYGTNTIGSTALRYGLDSERIEIFEPLESLGRDETRELARQALGPEYEGLADQLAAVGEDSPLVVTVGGLLVRQKHIDPMLLSKESEEFRSLVLDSFRDLFSRSLSDRIEPYETEGVLQLVAILSPVRPENNQFVEDAGSYLNMTPGRFGTVLRELEEAGAFVRRGGLVRITPDVLSDDILYEACRTPEDTTTTFVKHVLDHFGDQATERILRNLAEVDWRIRRTEGRSDLLDEIWKSILDKYAKGDVHDRARILSHLKDVAYYLPRRLLQMVEDILQEVIEDESIFADSLKDHLAVILQRIAYTLEFLPRCIELLWELIDLEKSPGPLSEGKAFNGLKELATPYYRKPIVVQERVLSAIESWIEDEGVYGNISGPRFLDVLDQLLAKSVAQLHAQGHEFQGRAHVVPMTYSQSALRLRAIEVILHYGTAEDAGIRDAIEAKDSLVNVLRSPVPLFGMAISEKDHQPFENQSLCALDALNKLRTHWENATLDVELLRSLRIHAQNAPSEEVRAQVSQIARNIDSDYDLRLAKSLMYSIDIRNSREDEIPPGYENHSEDPKALRHRTAREFIDKFPDPESGAVELNQRLKDLEDVVPGNPSFGNSKPVDPRLFLKLLASEDVLYAHGVAQHLIANPGGELDRYIAPFIEKAGENEDVDALVLTIEALNNGPKQSCSIAENPQLWNVDTEQQHVNIGKRVLQADDHMTRFLAIRSIHYAVEASRDKKNTLALQANIGGSAELADELFSIYSSQYGIPLGSVSDGEIRTLLQKLVDIERLDKHGIVEFLQVASERVPRAVFDLLFSRLRRETAERRPEYRAVPPAFFEKYVGFGETLQGLAESQGYRDMLRRIRDLMLEEDRAYSVPSVFVTLSSGINEAGQEVLREWLDKNCNPGQLCAILELIKEAPEIFVLENDDFIRLVLNTAHGMGREQFDGAKSELLWAVRSESRRRTAYRPAPKDARNRDRGRELAEKHATNPRLSGFYEDLSAAADKMIKHDLRKDEEREI